MANDVCLNLFYGLGIKVGADQCGCGQEGHGVPPECAECGDVESPVNSKGVCLSCLGVAI